MYKINGIYKLSPEDCDFDETINNRIHSALSILEPAIHKQYRLEHWYKVLFSIGFFFVFGIATAAMWRLVLFFES